jgi:hypothetical protein
LAVELRRVVALPELAQQIRVRDALGIVRHQDRLGVAGASGARLGVRRVLGAASGVAHRCRVHS